MRLFIFKSTLLALLLSIAELKAQSYQFTQYFNSFQFLNPSYQGITGHQYRYGVISRLQWLGLSGTSSAAYQTHAAFGSFMFRHPMSSGRLNPSKANKGPFLSGGLGVIQNNQVNGAFTQSSALGTAAVLVQLSPKTYASFGGDMTIHNAKVRDYILVNDYLNGSNFVTPGESIIYPNFSVGITLVANKLWLGASLKDIADTPQGATFITQTKDVYDFINLHGGYGFSIGDFGILKVSASYKHWKEVRQAEAAFGFVQNFASGQSFNATVGFRGLPATKDGLSNLDGIMAMLGWNNIKILTKENQAFRNRGNISIMLSTDITNGFSSKAFRTWEASLIVNSPYSKWDRKNCYDYSHGPMADQITQNLYGGKSPYAPPGARKEIGKDPNIKKRKSTIPNKRWNRRDKMKAVQPGNWQRRY